MSANTIVLILYVAALVAFILAWFNVPITNVVILGFILFTLGVIVERLGGNATPNRP